MAGAKFFEHVVHLGKSEVRVSLLAALAVGIELFSEEANTLALWFGGIRERERFKTASLVVAGVISITESTTGG
jgi:hypothetical protein